MKKYDLIYINGCSFTYGHGVPSIKAWPHLLGKKFDKEILNDSKNGNSMDTIVTRTIQQVLSLKGKTFYVIGLTWPGRYGFHIDDVMFNWSLAESKFPLPNGDSKVAVSKSTQLMGNISNHDMRIIYSDKVCEIINSYSEYSKKKITFDKKFLLNENLIYIRKILELQNFLKVQNIDYIFVNFNNMLFEDLLKSKIIELFVNQLDVSKIIDLKNYFVQMKFFNFLDTKFKRYDNEYEVASRRHTEYTKLNNHPTERGHEQICEKVYDFINR